MIEKSSEELGENAVVSTGCVLIVERADGEVARRADIVVRGDVLGTGKMNISQLVAMARSLSGARPLEGCLSWPRM